LPILGAQRDQTGGAGLGRSGWVPPGWRRDRRPDHGAAFKSKFSPPHLSITEAIVLAFGCIAAVGIFFGFYSGREAAGLNPIETLRYE
jgi:hypothetical protein